MTDPLTGLGLAIGKAAAGQVSSLIGRRALEWARGSETRQLVKLFELANAELSGDDLASARERRVTWLVQTARPHHLDDLGG